MYPRLSYTQQVVWFRIFATFEIKHLAFALAAHGDEEYRRY